MVVPVNCRSSPLLRTNTAEPRTSQLSPAWGTSQGCEENARCSACQAICQGTVLSLPLNLGPRTSRDLTLQNVDPRDHSFPATVLNVRITWEAQGFSVLLLCRMRNQSSRG